MLADEDLGLGASVSNEGASGVWSEGGSQTTNGGVALVPDEEDLQGH